MYRLLLALVTLLSFSTVSAADLVGLVVGVIDGDTLMLLTSDKRQVKVRLADIDTPEQAQPYGQKSKQALSRLVFKRQVEIHGQNVDRYGRTIGRVMIGELDVSRQLVADGAAWVYRKYSHDASLLQVEAGAREQQRGLWALPESQRVAPWDWRQRVSATAESLLTVDNVGSFSCTPRKTCGQMTNCGEANYHLDTCGNTRLDRDGDGIPCESLCN